MRIQLASDLHLEFLARRFPRERLIAPAADADVLVLAGDIGSGSAALRLFADWPVPVLYVAGNHEAYGSNWESVIAELSAAAEGTAVKFLERQSCELRGVRFLGCTLWTDYRLLGSDLQRQAQEYADRHLQSQRLAGAPWASPGLACG